MSSTLHASEVARTFRDVIDSPAPGSLEEHQALREIEARRHEETNPPSSRALKRRARRHWSDREHALGH